MEGFESLLLRRSGSLSASIDIASRAAAWIAGWSFALTLVSSRLHASETLDDSVEAFSVGIHAPPSNDAATKERDSGAPLPATREKTEAALVSLDDIDDVVVTARKRSNEKRAATSAVSTLSGHELRNSAISDFDELARYVPNVSLNTAMNAVYVRGIGTAELNVVSEQAIAYVLDGVYVPRLDYLKPGFMDVRRIQVIKGPKAMVFTRNASAGVIDVSYEEPTDESMSKAELTAGSDHLRAIEAATSGPLSKSLTFRIAGKWLEEDGHTLNRANGQTIGDRTSRQARVKLRYESSDSLDISWGASYFEYRIGRWIGGEIFEYPTSLRPAIVLLDPDFETDLDRKTSASRRSGSDGRGAIVPLRFEFDYEGHRLTSTTSYSRLDDFQGGDVDGSAAPLAELSAYSKSDTLSQEFRIISAPGDVEYVGGLSLYKSNIHTDVDFSIGVNPGFDTVSGVEILGPFSPLLESGALDPLTAEIFPGGVAANLEGRVSVDIESLSVFGQFTWHLSDAIALTAGGRYASDSRRGSAIETDQGPIPVWSLLVLGGYRTTRTSHDDHFSPTVSLTWDSGEAISLYATYAEGGRSGSYNVTAFSESDFEFKPERSSSYEAGIHISEFEDRVLFNLAIFSTTYEDYQLATFNGFSYDVTNADEVRSRGVETDLRAVVHQGLIAHAALGYNDAIFVESPRSACPTLPLASPGGLPPQGIGALPPEKNCDLSGEPLFRTPKWSGSLGLDYEAPLPRSPLHFLVGADTTYKGSEFMDADLDPKDAQAGYWLYNARIGLKDPAGRWRFVVHGKNLGDKLVKTFSGDVPLQAGAHWALTNPPRTFSATLELRF